VRRSQFLKVFSTRALGGIVTAAVLPNALSACRRQTDLISEASTTEASTTDATAQPIASAPSVPEGVWRVAIAPRLRPFAMLQANQPIGFDVDLIKAVGKACDVALRIELQPFDALIPLLESGQIDVAMGAIPITPARAQQIDFSRPYFRSGVAIAALSENKQFTALTDLTDKTVAVKLDTAGARLAIDIAGSKILTFDMATDALTSVETGEADAALIALPTLLAALKTGRRSTLQINALIEDHDFGMMLRLVNGKKNERLSAINSALKTLEKNGTYDEIYERWLGEPQ
jgi:ABC-type amino acid transport substrate-binding protein